MRWQAVEAQQPRLAELGRTKLGAPGVVLVATIRRDGSPRLSPVEPLFWDGDLWLGMGWETLKAKDLARDPRILVHSIVAGREGSAGEFKVRGLAVPETGRAEAGYADQVSRELGWNPTVGRFHLFRVDIENLTYIRWADDNDQYVTIWPEGVEFVRRGTSATSVGPREPMRDLLV